MIISQVCLLSRGNMCTEHGGLARSYLRFHAPGGGSLAHSSTAPMTAPHTTAAHRTKHIPSLVAYPPPTSVPSLALSHSMCLRKVEPFLDSRVGVKCQ